MNEGLYFVNGILSRVTPVTPELRYVDYVSSLNRARSEGVRFFKTEEGLTFAASTSNTGLLYAISLEGGCSCPGFTNRGYCKHYAKYISEQYSPQPAFAIYP